MDIQKELQWAIQVLEKNLAATAAPTHQLNASKKINKLMTTQSPSTFTIQTSLLAWKKPDFWPQDRKPFAILDPSNPDCTALIPGLLNHLGVKVIVFSHPDKDLLDAINWTLWYVNTASTHGEFQVKGDTLDGKTSPNSEEFVSKMKELNGTITASLFTSLKSSFPNLAEGAFYQMIHFGLYPLTDSKRYLGLIRDTLERSDGIPAFVDLSKLTLPSFDPQPASWCSASGSQIICPTGSENLLEFVGFLHAETRVLIAKGLTRNQATVSVSEGAPPGILDFLWPGGASALFDFLLDPNQAKPLALSEFLSGTESLKSFIPSDSSEAESQRKKMKLWYELYNYTASVKTPKNPQYILGENWAAIPGNTYYFFKDASSLRINCTPSTHAPFTQHRVYYKFTQADIQHLCISKGWVL
jgi:hypothetical protein